MYVNCSVGSVQGPSVQSERRTTASINRLHGPRGDATRPCLRPAPFPMGPSGHLPAGQPLFCSITANAVVCRFPLHFLIIFSSGICYRIKTKREKKNILLRVAETLGFFNTCRSTSPGYCAILFHRALNKQVLLIFKSCTFGGAGRSQS